MRRIFTTALLTFALIAVSAAAAGQAVKVSPGSGSTGTRFTVSFVTPLAEPAHGYEVLLRAASNHGNSCVAKFDFFNPKKVAAKLRLKFAFRPSAAEELCTGSWKVSVRATASGVTLLSGGHFTLS